MTEQTTIRKHAAIYGRVSTKDQDCKRQLDDLRGFAAAHNLGIAYEGLETASGAREDRRERNKLMELARAKMIQVILVSELSRWGRSLTDLVSTVQELQGYGVILWPINQAPIDVTSPTGKIILTVFGMMAEFERDLIRERTLSGLAAARARGQKLGRRPGSGKTIKKHTELVIDLRQKGFSYRDIATKLRIGTETVKQILQAEAERQCKEQNKQKIVDLLRTGESINSICARTHIPKRIVKPMVQAQIDDLL